uniref:Uncharacterized protein n=1 Tax=Caenorhabditis japonica TaxID=281687 RepID=A0A8R1HSV3_CAEJA
DDDFGEIAAGVVPEDYQKMMEDSRMDIERELALNASMATNDLFGRSREPTPFLNDAHAPGNAIFGDDDFAGGAGDDEHVDENDHNFQSSSGVEMNHMNEEMEYENEQIIMNHGAMTPLRSETPMTQRPPSPTGSVATSVTNMDQEDTVESFYERQAQKRAMQQQVNSKRRRVDEVKMISGDEMKANMADFSDTLNRLDLAPPTRDEMLRKKRGMMEYLHHYPGMINFGKARQFIRLYQSNLIIKKSEDTDAKNETITNALGLREIGEEEIQAQQQEMDLNLVSGSRRGICIFAMFWNILGRVLSISESSNARTQTVHCGLSFISRLSIRISSLALFGMA